MNIGIECGGTFTDMVVCDDDGELKRTAKVLSTPSDPSIAVGRLLDLLPSEWLSGAELFHGSTVATNALIERKGPRVALVSTAGFGDVIFIQRQDRERMFDLKYERPAHLVKRDDVFEVHERMDSEGNVVQSLNLDEVNVLAESLKQKSIRDVAVSLMHSYANDVHEQEIREVLNEKCPEVTVTLSSAVAPEFREYERVSTTVISAFLNDRVSHYLNGVKEKAQTAGISRVEIMQSNGGRVPVTSAIANPLGMLRSGPAAGVSGAIAAAAASGLRNFVTLDMGGTSTDVALVQEGNVNETTEMSEDGLPVRVPMVDIVAVGAGGGSIAHLDSGGLLSVGPQSAGADPGPAAYQRGGTEPTVTDTNVARGLLRGNKSLVDDLSLSEEAALASLNTISDALALSPVEAAEQVAKLASSQMAGAIRIATVEKGVSIGDHALVVYGGAGPLHAAEVADELNLELILVPPHNGLTSAYGLLAANFRRYFSRSIVRTASEDSWPNVQSSVRELRAEAESVLRSERLPVDELEFTASFDMRYFGQGFEISVPAEPWPITYKACVSRFHDLHEEFYGYSNDDAIVQVITLRLRVDGPPVSIALPKVNGKAGNMVEKEIVEKGHRISCTFVERAALRVGFSQAGPMVVEDETSTTYVPTGWTLSVDPSWNLVLRK